jgi:glutathione S-transferase
MSNRKPTLWQIDVSHYSEKARWALAYKGVEHRRRSPVPGVHVAVALWLTRGRSATFPILILDGRNVADSTAIIAALEQRYPEPSLYPADPEQRRRALELEDHFDEELGPQIRRLAWHELGSDPEKMRELMQLSAPVPLRRFGGATALYARGWTALRFGAASEEGAAKARTKVLAALDRLDAELARSTSGYLVGDSFSVADLTAASLFYPLVGPAEGPLPPDQSMPDGFEGLREETRGRPGFAWVEEMFRRHRKPAGDAGTATAH